MLGKKICETLPSSLGHVTVFEEGYLAESNI